MVVKWRLNVGYRLFNHVYFNCKVNYNKNICNFFSKSSDECPEFLMKK